MKKRILVTVLAAFSAPVYALYTKLRNGALASYSLSSNASVGGTSTIAGAGASPSAFAVGLKITF